MIYVVGEIELGIKLDSICERNNCKGKMIEYNQDDQSCSCHINPPCSKCCNTHIECDTCGFIFDTEKTYSLHEGLIFNRRRRNEKDLDKSKIDWISYPHTHFSMKKVGVYPPDKTESEVLKEVVGTFGGRFEHFGNGKFTYIAYTD